MALQLGALRDALLDAHVSPEKAAAAAEEVASYENRLTGIENRLTMLDARMTGLGARMTALESRMTMLTLVAGINATATLAILGKLLTLH
ncbi:MAG: hypothetical protein ACJ8AW_30605 [Rhodopila sp.]